MGCIECCKRTTQIPSLDRNEVVLQTEANLTQDSQASERFTMNGALQFFFNFILAKLQNRIFGRKMRLSKMHNLT